jgi:hypothetical protein
VPSEHPWPKPSWGVPLGKIVNDIRNRRYGKWAARDQGQLELLGFAWNHNVAIWTELMMQVLETYVAEFGTSNVPLEFVVPACDPWPKRTSGFTLGSRVHRIRNLGSYFAIVGRDVDRLEKLGYSFELRLRGWEKYVEPLLDTYVAVFRSTAVPADFIIPREAPWPEKCGEFTWAFSLLETRGT